MELYSYRYDRQEIRSQAKNNSGQKHWNIERLDLKSYYPRTSSDEKTLNVCRSAGLQGFMTPARLQYLRLSHVAPLAAAAVAVSLCFCVVVVGAHAWSPSSRWITASCKRNEDRIASSRTYDTPADAYYKQHQRLPHPPVVHAVLDNDDIIDAAADDDDASSNDSILVIGDVHGCYEELLALHKKAVQLNGNQEFRRVILVGDLCNKGPQSVAVLRHVQEQAPRWMSVRGNHDNGALLAALGDERRRSKASYAWVFGGDDDNTPALSDSDVLWMAQLPYSIRITGRLLNQDMDTIIVHAGLVPGVRLEEQSVSAMTNLRDVCQVSFYDGGYRMAQEADDDQHHTTKPWATLWSRCHGEESVRVIFGHDARRGLQRHPNVIGLDTGACYGKQLTGVILSPHKQEATVVSVPAARVYCPIGG